MNPFLAVQERAVWGPASLEMALPLVEMDNGCRWGWLLDKKVQSDKSWYVLHSISAKEYDSRKG